MRASDTTLDDENALQHVTSVVVPALSNQPEAFASDFGDDRSRYLLTVVLQSLLQHHQEAEWMLADRTAAN